MRKVTVANVLEDAHGRWLEIFQHVAPGVFDEAIKRLGSHVRCPIHGGAADFRFVEVGSKKGSSTAECGVAFCTCGYYKNGFDVLQKVTSCSFSELLHNVHGYLHQEAGRGAGVQVSRAAEREVPALSREKVLSRLRRLWNPADALDDATPYYRLRGISEQTLSCVRSIRVAPRLPYFDAKKMMGTWPALLGLMRASSGEPVAVHRTWLSKNRKSKLALKRPGQKEPLPAKKLTQCPIGGAAGAAIRLFDVQGDTLGIAEGMETAMSAYQLSSEGYFNASLGLSTTPVWACYSKDNLANFELPPELIGKVRRIVIFTDNDLNGAGVKASRKAAEVLRKRYHGLEVQYPAPSEPGDWNDVLMQLAAKA